MLGVFFNSSDLNTEAEGRVLVKNLESLNIGNFSPLSHPAAIKIQLQNGIII